MLSAKIGWREGATDWLGHRDSFELLPPASVMGLAPREKELAWGGARA